MSIRTDRGGHGTPSGGHTALLVGLFTLLLYSLSAAPGLYWGDSAQLQLATARPSLGLGARSYPLWTNAAAAFHSVVGLSPASSANLFSALCGALAVGLCCGFLLRLGVGTFSAVTGAGALAVSHLVWSSSVVAEVYSLNAVFYFALSLCALAGMRGSRRAILLFGIVAGVSLLHHRTIQITALALALPILRRGLADGDLRRHLAALALGLLCGVLPFLLLLVLGPGRAADAGLRGILLGSFEIQLPAGFGLGRGLFGLFLYDVRFLVFNLLGLPLLLAPAGFLRLRRKMPETLGLLIWPALFGLLQPALFPHLGDRYVLLLPTVCALAVFSGAGAAPLAARCPRLPMWAIPAGVVLLTALAYFSLAHSPLLRRAGFFRGATDVHAREFIWPPKPALREPEAFGRSVLHALPEGALLYAGWGEGAILDYLQQQEGVRPDVSIHLLKDLKRLDLNSGDARPRFLTAYPHLTSRRHPDRRKLLTPVIEGALWRLPGP